MLKGVGVNLTVKLLHSPARCLYFSCAPKSSYFPVLYLSSKTGIKNMQHCFSSTATSTPILIHFFPGLFFPNSNLMFFFLFFQYKKARCSRQILHDLGEFHYRTVPTDYRLRYLNKFVKVDIVHHGNMEIVSISRNESFYSKN